MGKAMLIMDMPESCSVCDFGCEEVYGDYCGVPWCGKDVSGYEVCRPDFCPLREVPEKCRITGASGHTKDYVDGYRTGWNACLEAITGKNEDLGKDGNVLTCEDLKEEN